MDEEIVERLRNLHAELARIEDEIEELERELEDSRLEDFYSFLEPLLLMRASDLTSTYIREVQKIARNVNTPLAQMFRNLNPYVDNESLSRLEELKEQYKRAVGVR